MKETLTELSRRPRPSILAIVLYVLAGLCVVGGIIGVVLLSTPGEYLTAYRESGISVPARAWVILINGALAALVFGAAGALVTYLHEIRDRKSVV